MVLQTCREVMERRRDVRQVKRTVGTKGCGVEHSCGVNDSRDIVVVAGIIIGIKRRHAIRI